MRFFSLAFLATASCQYADQSKMSEREKHAYWDELLEIRRMRDKDPTQLTVGEVARVAQYYEDIKDWLHRQKSPEEMEKFYERLNHRTKRREGLAEQKREVFRERIKNITEALTEAEDEYEFQAIWDQIYPDKIPYSMKASSSEWMIKKDFRKRAEQMKRKEQGENYVPSFLTNKYEDFQPDDREELEKAEKELFNANSKKFDDWADDWSDSYDYAGYSSSSSQSSYARDPESYQDPEDEEEVLAE